jgi:hypothetical protein
MVSAHAGRGPRTLAGHRRRPTRRTFLRVVGSAAAAGVGVAAGGCGEWAPGFGIGIFFPDGLDPAALADRYIALTLELAKHQPSLVDVWLGDDTRAKGPRRPAPTLRADAAALAADVTRLLESQSWAMMRALPADPATPPERSPATRVDYLAGQVRALDLAAGRLVGESRSFADEAVSALGHAAPARDAAAFDDVRRELSERLRGTGTLAERHAAFRRALAVPADRIEAVFRAAVGWCRDAARERLPLPDGETVTMRGSDDAGWAAFSRPSGPRTSQLWIARHGGADVAQMLQLAAHESTPGHHAQHVLASHRLVETQGWSERALYPAFGPHRLLAEGAAEAGAELLLPLAVREQVCAEVLLPIAGQRPSLAGDLVRIERLVAALDLEVAYAAADYLDGTGGSADAAARLRDDALLLDPAGMVSFIEKQRSRVLAYPVGRRLVTDVLGTGDDATRWRRFARVSTALTLGAAIGE